MKMVVNSIRTLFVLFTLALLTFSCSKNDPDPLDQYVGSWSETMLNGKSSSGDELTITKSGASLTIAGLVSNNITASLDGSGIKADNKSNNTGSTFTFSDNTRGTLYVQNLTGSITNGDLTLKYTLYAESSTKYVSADFTEVFKKK